MRNERVIMAMSGGVDSAVAAVLLKERGTDVHGLFMRNWTEDNDGYCTAARDRADAESVCRRLDIPLHVVDFSQEYRDQVFSRFLADYRQGRTPNPDVLCNREIKFGVLLDYVRRLGAARLATGHYARVDHVGNGGARLLRARDRAKDQTYFLCQVGEAALSQVEFPLGGLTKQQVRQKARDAGLSVHDKADSTGICFIGERPFREFLMKYLPADPGPIETEAGDVVGQHNGLAFYTLGQRQGLAVGGVRSAADAPWYVIAKQAARNALVVAQRHDHPALMATRLVVDDLHWTRGEPLLPARCTASVRYRQVDAPCEISREGAGRYLIEFDEPQRAVTPGQYAAVYAGPECLGGGVISSVHCEPETFPQESEAAV